MNRQYKREHYLERVEALRKAVPGIGLTTDLIVGFPGETEEEFLDTVSLVEEVRYDSAYTFIFSLRKGTKAADMPGQLDPAVASERIERLIAVQERITGEILSGMKGSTARVLVEGVSKRRDTQLTGKSERNINVNFKQIMFDLNGTTVTHRVVSNDPSERSVVTKGDANDMEDISNTHYSDLVGVVKYHIPVLGDYLMVILRKLKII